MKSCNRIVNILLIEDSSRRRKLILNALKRANIHCRLHSVGVGKDALNYLRQCGPFREAPRPDLVLFDFSQPVRGYVEKLDELISDAKLDDISFALLTSPATERLLEDRTEENGGVMFSPIELDQFLNTMKSLPLDRFLNAVTLIAKSGFVLIRVAKKFAVSKSPIPIRRAS